MASPATTTQTTTARERVLHAARSLFSEYGVSGTSLQMIADHLGVTKAAVYHQFHTKDEIVLALLDGVGGRIGRHEACDHPLGEALTHRRVLVHPSSTLSVSHDAARRARASTPPRAGSSRGRGRR